MRKHSKYALETSCVYFVGYGVIRFFVEGLRTDSLYITGTAIRASQLLSVFLVVGGLLYIAYAHYKKIERKPLPERFLIAKSAAAPAVTEEAAGAADVSEADVAKEETAAAEEPAVTEEPESSEMKDDGNP